jgi:hypothetical protein
LLAEQPQWRERFRLEVYGSEIDPEARSLIATLGLTDVVMPMGRLEYDKATGLSGRERVVQRMQQVDALLLLHGDTAECPQYIPSKLYDYFWTRRPVFALTHRNPQLDELVRSHGGHVAPTTEPEAIRAGLAAWLQSWDHHQLCEVTAPPVSVAQCVHAIVGAVDALPHHPARSLSRAS